MILDFHQMPDRHGLQVVALHFIVQIHRGVNDRLLPEMPRQRALAAFGPIFFGFDFIRREINDVELPIAEGIFRIRPSVRSV